MLGYLYLNILQAVQIFGAETWVVNPRIRRVLGGFHHQVARQIAGKQLWRLANRSWDHPPMEEAMRVTRLEDMGTYISRHQNTVA